ncbi:hypothetical protein LCGC14_2009360 [marine sediment metagenome]|uniref:Uncharacterized protein n=1 Tax=marine sediment metagenome TaxID=412755 RepID=A0A0F9F0Y3_9ZZZZ
MGNSAEDKLEKADRLNARATKIRKRDPESARDLDSLARSNRRTAIKQMRRKPPSRKQKDRVVL